MPVYVIHSNAVAAHACEPANIEAEALLVRSEAELRASNLPNTQLVAIWNALPGAAAITRFKDRTTAARRLWAAFAKLPLAAGPEASSASKTKRSSRKSTTSPRRAESKQAQVIALLKRPGGATLAELADATGWQRHTVRGAIAGALKKKLKLPVESMKRADGQRAYVIA